MWAAAHRGGASAPLHRTLLTVTYGGETIRIYRNGVAALTHATAAAGSGWQTWTNFLVTNTSPLRLGASAAGALALGGMLDEVQLFAAGMSPPDVQLHTSLGMCSPP